MTSRFFRFALVGAVATGTTYVVLILGVEVLGLSAVLSSIVGYLLGMGVNYSLNYRYTFAASGRHTTVFPRFLTVMFVGMLVNATVMFACVDILSLHYLLAQFLAIAVVLSWSYSANRFWTFAG